MKKFSFTKCGSSRCFSSGSLAVFIGAAPPPFRIFAGGLPRRRRRRNAFGLIQEYCTIEEIASFEGSPRLVRHCSPQVARRLICIGFSGQKRIGALERRKENFLIPNLATL